MRAFECVLHAQPAQRGGDLPAPLEAPFAYPLQAGRKRLGLRIDG